MTAPIHGRAKRASPHFKIASVCVSVQAVSIKMRPRSVTTMSPFDGIRCAFVERWTIVSSSRTLMSTGPSPAAGANESGIGSAGVKTKGYDTMTMPPPSGGGNRHRRTAATVHDSTRPSCIVVSCTADSLTCPETAIVNRTMTRPNRSGRSPSCSS